MNNIFQAFAGATPGGATAIQGMSLGGALDQFADLQKALEASNYQTDVSTLTGGGALGVQSLDTAMKTTIQDNSQFVLFNRLAASNATNIVDEYVRQNSVGGVLGGSTNSQMGVVRAAQGDYSREVGLVKFLMSLRQVGYVLNIGKNIIEATSVEEQNGALQLLTDAEYLLFHGNAAASPTQFDGIFAQIDAAIAAGQMDGSNVIDMQAQPITSVQQFSQINQSVSNYGSWGKSTDVFLPNSVQTDLNMSLDPAFRWVPQGQNTPLLGGHVEGIRLTHGVLKTNMDTFLHYDEHPMTIPWDAQPGLYQQTASGNSAYNPTSIAGVAANDTASMFTASIGGNYFYCVAAIAPGGAGYSQSVVSAQVAVSAGQSVTLTITKSANGGETGYAVYRGRLNGTNAPSDMRLMQVIPVAATGNTTTYKDQNRFIPGTVTIPVLNMGPSADAISWRQFQPMTKIPLPFGVGGMPVISWFQFLFGYLRVTKPKHHGYIKNVLPNSVTSWKPFG